MKKLLIIMGLSLLILLTGCDKKDKNLEMYVITRYANTTESIKINTFNGYKLIDSKVKENKDGSIEVVLKANKPIK